MKKFLILILNLYMALPLLSCENNTKQESIIPEKESNGKTETVNNKILIVYFSRTGENYAVGNINIGNTAIMASYIQDYTGGASFEIIPSIPYPDDYDETCKISQQETADNARPAIKYQLMDLEQYSIVFVGCPIWYGAPPMIIRTFYETYRNELANKTIVPFGTHEGSGVSSCTNLVKEYFPNGVLLETFGVRGQNVKISREKIEDWLHRIGISKNNQSNND